LLAATSKGVDELSMSAANIGEAPTNHIHDSAAAVSFLVT
jgi:hypothetical protein